MILALCEKELRQHGSMILLFWIFMGVGLSLLLGNDLLVDIGGSGFSLVSWLLLVLFPLACLVLGNALIATEFRQKTQIFLDGLPLPRWKMVAVKYGCGLAAAQLTALMPLAIVIARDGKGEALDASFLTLLFVKTTLWAWFCWAAIFPFSLLGRYRMIVGLFVVIGLMFAQNVGEVPVNRFGPFELMGDQFAYERVVYPLQAIGITVVLIIVLTYAGFSMSLVRDATLATMLSEKMSSREKMAMIALGMAGLMIGTSLSKRIESTDPLDLPDSIDVVESGVAVSIAAAVALPTAAEREAMQQHAQSTAQLVREVADFLGLKKLPPLFLVHRRDLEAAEFQDGEIDSRQGCLIRLNVLKTPYTDASYHSHIVEKLLDANQHYRLSSDSRGWILEGFAYWWPRRSLTELPFATDSLAAASITEQDILRWKKFRLSLPEGTSSRFAAHNIAALWKKNESGCHEFLKATLGHSPPHDIRATIHDGWYNVPFLVRSLLQMDLKELAMNWNSAVATSPQNQESRTQ